jgi:hypothetical protein
MEVKEREAFPAGGELPGEQLQEVRLSNASLSNEYRVFAAVTVWEDHCPVGWVDTLPQQQAGRTSGGRLREEAIEHG